MQKRLYRSKTHRMFAGVCGGIAEYLDIDPTIARLIGVVFALSGAGVIVYVLLWILIPENPAK